jgi:signal transduction histidine kinase
MSSLLSTLQELPDDELLPLARSAAIGSLSGGIAHDAGNALFGILGLLELATAGRPVDPDRLRLLRTSAGELDASLRPLLRFARAEGGGTADLAGAVREALDLYLHGDRKELAVTGTLPEGPAPVACRPADLLQACVHVLLAADPHGSLEIQIEDGRLRVRPAGGTETIDTIAARRIAANAGGALTRDGDGLVLALPRA